jgi:hypothetical protein
MASDLRTIVAGQLTSQATRQATEGVDQLTLFVRENNWSLRGVSFIGSLAMMIFSLIKVLNVFGIFGDVFGYVINLYSFVFASVMLALEARDEWPLVHVCIFLFSNLSLTC